MSAPDRMCSGPSSSRMAVPEAALFPSTPRLVCLEHSATISCEKPCAKPGNGRLNTTPIISQCPVTESFPADASAIRPTAAEGAFTGGEPPSAATRPRPRRRRTGSCNGICLAILPSVLLPASPYTEASGNSPIPTLSSTMTIALVKVMVARDLSEKRPTEGRSSGRPEVVGDRLGRLDGRDRVLEDHVVGARVIEHHGRPIEVLDAAFELRSVHHPHGDRELLAADVIEKHVLDVRLGDAGFGGGRH